MWKKVLAIISIPFWLLILFSMINATMISIAAGQGPTSSLLPYYFGMGLGMALFGWLLFFWGRWIWRVLFRRKLTTKLEWPE